MASRESTYIFHLFRKDGEPLILHPFPTAGALVSALENREISGRYASEPRVEALTVLRNELYRMVETGVQRWVSDKRFVPRFLMSSGLFLLAYFFLSFVIRDPIPVIDEIAFSLAAAVGAYVLIGRRDIRSDLAARKRVSLRAAVDRIVFTESRFAATVEASLQETESGTLRELVEKIVSPSDRTELKEEDRAEAAAFVRMVEERYKLRGGRKDERLFRRYLARERGADPDWIRRWAQTRKIDVPLYAVYRRLKRTVTAGS